MIIRADVKTITGAANHYFGKIVEGELVRVSTIPDPSWVEIHEEGGGYYLFRYDGTGKCLTDTWHPTLEEAKGQAKFEFEISPDEWRPAG